jgi:hypothetical protein
MAVRLTPPPSVSQFSRESGIFDVLQTYRPLRPTIVIVMGGWVGLGLICWSVVR